MAVSLHVNCLGLKLYTTFKISRESLQQGWAFVFSAFSDNSNMESNNSTLPSLPSEMMEQILKYVDANDVVHLSMASKIFLSIWPLVTKFYIPFTSSSKVGLIFKKTFKVLQDFEILNA
jgi:septum formation topological specificity factor MinE